MSKFENENGHNTQTIRTWLYKKCEKLQIQWTLVTTTAFVPKYIVIKMNLLLYWILNEQMDI